MVGQGVRVVIRTAAGDDIQVFSPNLRLIDVCRLLRVPPSAVSLFAVGDSTRRVVGVDEPLGTLVAVDRETIVLQFDRNLNYRALLSDAPYDPGDNAVTEPVAEYIFPSGTYGQLAHAKLNVENCRKFVHESVADFVEAHQLTLLASPTIVIGTSGGGDSNALLTALVDATRDLPMSLTPVMLLGMPEWDAAAERATELCESLGLKLRFVESNRVNQLLGRANVHPRWLADFRKHFPCEDSDVIGTLAIRLALSDVARTLDTQCVVTGLNLEDLLAECLLRLIQGELPLSFPIRPLDGITFCYPIYRVPKKILDGCYPQYALANYKQRSVGVMMGRAIPYFLAQSMNSVVPGIEFDMLEGSRSLPHVSPPTSAAFGFATLVDSEMGHELSTRWTKYIQGVQPAPA